MWRAAISPDVSADSSTYLGRRPRDAEIAGCVAAFDTGLANEDVIAAFVASEQCLADHL
jgi:hypothetical protein